MNNKDNILKIGDLVIITDSYLKDHIGKIVSYHNSNTDYVTVDILNMKHYNDVIFNIVNLKKISIEDNPEYFI